MVLQSPRGIESGYGVNVRNAGLRHPPFSDLGNTSEIANSLPSNVRSINKLEVLEQTLKQEGTTPRQKTREEWLDRIDELEAEMRPCRIRLIQSQTSSNGGRRSRS